MKLKGGLLDFGGARPEGRESRFQSEADRDNSGGDVMDMPRHLRKMRACLRCRVTFQSEWVGERICEKCKKSHDWRSGLSNSPEFLD